MISNNVLWQAVANAIGSLSRYSKTVMVDFFNSLFCNVTVYLYPFKPFSFSYTIEIS